VQRLRGVKHECAGGQSGEQLGRVVGNCAGGLVPASPCDDHPAIAFNQIITSVTARGPSFCRDMRSIGHGLVCSTQTFLTSCCAQHSIVAMGKSKDKQSAKTESRPKTDKPSIKVDKKAFDPTLASLFATSVRLFLPTSIASCCPYSTSMLTEYAGRPSASSPKVTLSGPCTKRE
jgi:hypothetical protein